jgi:acyl carrier protein
VSKTRSAEEIRARLRAFICRELLGDPSYPLRDDEPIISGGLIDSFYLAHLAVFVEDEFGVVIPDVDLTVENFDTLDQWVARILEDLGLKR